MSGIPKEPRALMIQMMYIVLTAMLALNITREVLDAFSTINTSIENSNDGLKEKNLRTYASFDHIADRNPDLKKKRDSLYPMAIQVKEESEKMIQYLETWKVEMVKQGGGWIEEGGEKKVKFMDNIDVSTNLFVEKKNGNEVKQHMIDFVNKILSFAGGDDSERLRNQLPLQIDEKAKTDNNPTGDWSFGTFHNIPVIAAITLFSKWQSDVRNSEAMMVEHLMAQVGDDDFQPDVIKFNAFMAVATPNISYALAGDEITATVAMAAYDKTINPSVTSNVGAVSVSDGVGTIKFRASGTGVQTVRGTITVQGKNDKKESQPWSFNYTVGTSGASLQLDKMNVMYIGVDNPVTISASGYNLNDVSWKMEGANIKEVSPGKYNVRVDKANYQGAPYSIIATSKTGAKIPVLNGLIRIKPIPPPIIKFGKLAGSGSMTTGEIRAQQGLAAVLENFDFEYKYLVTGYNLVYIPRGSDMADQVTGRGNLFSNAPGAKAVLERAKPGDRVIFENIRIKGDAEAEKPALGSISVLVR
ncbi:MAG TPA: gliding motility protein GldM [Edaphocola sp.]|nr:gliding motility protein GldM [Edaphocola sp.]